MTSLMEFGQSTGATQTSFPFSKASLLSKDAATDGLGATSFSSNDGQELRGSFETGIEYQKFARAMERLLRQRVENVTDIDFRSLLPEFDALCSTRAQQFEHRKDSDAGYQAFGAVDEYKLWQAEGHTWLLLSVLLSTLGKASTFKDKGPDSKAWSDLDFIEHLASTDPNFKRHAAVKLWLEIIAPVFTPQTGSIQYTQKPFGLMSSTKSIDPDVTTRDGTKGTEHNQHVEHELLKTVWEYIRRGQLDKAKDACRKAGEPWRADSISGGDLYSVSALFRDPQHERNDGTTGNKTRGLWKGTCYALASDTTADPYERAVYGALSGDVTSVLSVCSTWEDHTWVMYNALLESMIEGRLSQFHRGGVSSALPHPSCKITSAKDIFENLTNSEIPELRNVSNDMFKEIQRSIILGQTDLQLTRMARRARESGENGLPLRPHMLRFMAHFVIFLRSSDSNVPPQDGDYFIKSYVDYLISRKMYDIAPLYASFLPMHLQIECCSSYLRLIRGPRRERLEHVNTLRRYGLDLRRVLIATVDELLAQDSRASGDAQELKINLGKSLATPVPTEAQGYISALEWLTFDTDHYEECLVSSNHLIRRYLATGQMNVAYAVSNSLPSDITQALPQDRLSMSLAITQEYYHYRDLLSARLSYEEWQEILVHKPLDDESLRSHVLTWEMKLRDKAQQAIREIESLLRSRWLSDCNSLEDGVRDEEMRQLRQVYVSELVMNLHNVYFESRVVTPEYLEKSVEMANMVASESGAVPLYKEMQENQRLQEFLALVRLSSMELIKEHRPPFAF
ncbi:Nucleoporin nup84 [Lunasporangiospora selenospora]|uniref:Nuclear pore complex protein n=1 Tax=Lunasporangiospora selenospora TaxID=979761 RepID=A0A9P6KGL1_9FUNG|nr:Nucleoporin nup84 [Lunasporangiospora selenospora]